MLQSCVHANNRHQKVKCRSPEDPLRRFFGSKAADSVHRSYCAPSALIRESTKRFFVEMNPFSFNSPRALHGRPSVAAVYPMRAWGEIRRHTNIVLDGSSRVAAPGTESFRPGLFHHAGGIRVLDLKIVSAAPPTRMPGPPHTGWSMLRILLNTKIGCSCNSLAPAATTLYRPGPSPTKNHLPTKGHRAHIFDVKKGRATRAKPMDHIAR